MTNQNWLDKTISYFSPRTGLQRARARALESLSYEGAKTGRRGDGWLAAPTDANAEIGASLAKLRQRSRDLVRNNPFASKVILEIERHSVGYGITPQARTGDEALDKRVDDLFARWSEVCDSEGTLDFYGMQSLWARSIAESGGVFVRPRPRMVSDGLIVPLQLQTLESDFCQLGRAGSVGTSYIIQGAQFDQLGKREGYWLYNRHPGLNAAGPGVPGAYLQANFVPCDKVLYGFRQERPGQIHGVPWLAASMLKMRDLADYDEAELVRKKIESCVAGFVTQVEGPDGPSLAPVSTNTKPGQRVEEFSPGMIEYLRQGESIVFNSPVQSGGYREYSRTQLEAIGSGIGIPYILLSGDFSATNYSSSRAAIQGWRRIITAFQWHNLIPMLLTPIWHKFIDAAVAAGELPANTNYGVEWTPPKFEAIDPLHDAEADLVEVRTGKKTLFQLITEQGRDPHKHLDEIASINKLLDTLGIVLDSDPRKVAKTGVAQGGETGPSQGGEVNGQN